MKALVADLRARRWHIAASFLAAWQAGLAFGAIAAFQVLNADGLWYGRAGFPLIALATWCTDAFFIRKRWHREARSPIH